MTTHHIPVRKHPLRARMLPLARVGWLAVVGLALVQWAVSLPALYRMIQRPCHTLAECDLPGALPTDGLAALSRAGIAPQAWAIYILALLTAVIVVWLAVALAIFIYRADDPGTLLIALLLALISLVANEGQTEALIHNNSVWSALVVVEAFFSSLTYGALFLLFPNGRFVPRWTRWVLLAVVVKALIATFSPADSVFHAVADSTVSMAFDLVGAAVIVYAQIYRYRQVSSPVERQQTKWATFGLLIAVIGFSLGSVVLEGVGGIGSGSLPLVYTLYAPVQLCIPISIGIAILRFRLYDIDVLIRRTLIYGSLTAILVGVYLALVLGAQSALHALTGTRGDEPIIIVASTLVIAALFNPLRKRLQAIIDRRFFRAKYDTSKTLAAFGKSLRTQTDLPQLSEHLVAVVEETMRPAHVSLWLRPTAPRPPEGAAQQNATALAGGAH